MATPKKRLNAKQLNSVKAARSISLSNVIAKKQRHASFRGIMLNSQPDGK